MASRFWVGGTGTWDSSTTTNWSTSTGGTGGASAPTLNDDVFLDGGSGVGIITTAAGAICHNFDATGYTGTLTITSGLSIAAAAAGTIKFAAGMTLNGTGTITIGGPSSGANATLTTAGRPIQNLTIQCASFGVTLADPLTVTGVMTLDKGALDLAGQTCLWGTYSSSSSNTRTLTMGNAQITILGTAQPSWDMGNNANLTVTANTATITFSGASSGASLSSTNMNGASFVVTGGGSFRLDSIGGTLQNLTVTGTAVKTDQLRFESGNLTIAGTFTANGNSVLNRLLVMPGLITTPTFVQKTVTAAVTVLNNADFMNITGAGAATWTGTSIGDMGNNVGITADVAVQQTWQGTSGGLWSNSLNWTSRVPLPQDNVKFGNAFLGGQTITVDMPRIGHDIDFTGTTGNPALSYGTGIGNNWTIFGSANFTGLGSFVATNSADPQFMATSPWTLTTGGKSIPGGAGNDVRFLANTTGTLLDDLAWGCAPQLNAGKFDANGHNVSAFAWSNNANLVMGSGVWTLNGSGQVWNANASTPLDASAATILLTSTSSAAMTFVGGGKRYNIVRRAVTGTGALTITGNNTFVTLDVEAVNAARTLTLSANSTQMITGGGTLTLRGLPGQTLSIVSATPGSPVKIVVADGSLYNLDNYSPSADVTITLPLSSGGGTGQGIAWKGHV